jgi:hypothetical protein
MSEKDGGLNGGVIVSAETSEPPKRRFRFFWLLAALAIAFGAHHLLRKEKDPAEVRACEVAHRARSINWCMAEQRRDNEKAGEFMPESEIRSRCVYAMDKVSKTYPPSCR